ncbi:uncharacterized protein LOC135681083 [Rhopilema esculentum]|uniref:uncharacterized protein LOC135681083 n=1 Tax=Rhopilema esculentum TaxID=499914 RepID=UPI0031D208B5
MSAKEVPFLDTIVYIDNRNHLQTRLHRKPTDRQNYLHRASEHPLPLKNSLAYSQALRIKRICSDNAEYENNTEQLVKAFTSRGYERAIIDKQIKEVDSISREELLKQNSKKTTSNRTPFITTYNRTLPPIGSILRKNWNILNINPKIAKSFKNSPMMSYKRNKNLRDILGSNKISNNEVAISKSRNEKGHCKPCNTKQGNLCCQQVLSTSTFRSNQTKRTYVIRHKVNCKSKYVIYLLECIKCGLQYIGKSETQVNLRINNHRKDSSKSASIPVCQHFNNTSHNFNNDAKFIIIEQLKSLEGDKELLRSRLQRREDFWIKKLKTLSPLGLNMELNSPI